MGWREGRVLTCRGYDAVGPAVVAQGLKLAGHIVNQGSLPAGSVQQCLHLQAATHHIYHTGECAVYNSPSCVFGLQELQVLLLANVWEAAFGTPCSGRPQSVLGRLLQCWHQISQKSTQLIYMTSCRSAALAFWRSWFHSGLQGLMLLNKTRVWGMWGSGGVGREGVRVPTFSSSTQGTPLLSRRA